MNNSVIFDLDGTLVNLNIDFNALKRQIKDILQIQIEPTPLLEIINSQTEHNLILRQQIWDLIDEIELKSVNQIEIFPESLSVLKKLKKENYTIALVTLQGRKATNLIVNNYFPNCFKKVITREYSYLREIQLQIILDQLKIQKERIIMVGDRLNDVKSSEKVGIKCILVRRTYNPLKNTIVVKSLSEIFQYLS